MVETTTCLRLARCQVCSVLFAVDALTYLSAMEDRGPLSCPIGHRPAVSWSDADSLELVDVNLRLMAELRQSKFDNDQLRRRLASMPSPTEAVTDAKELKRRAEILAERAEKAAYGRGICIFCGKPVGRSRLRDHLRRTHTEKVAEMPADSFI